MISLAVAGFGMDNLSIEKDKNTLKIEGTAPKGDDEVNYHTEELVEDLP